MASTSLLEAAPNSWNGKKAKCPSGCNGTHFDAIGGTIADYGPAGAGAGTGSAYCSGSGEHHPIPAANSAAIGTGYQNRTAIVQNCVPNHAGDAAAA